MVSICHFEATAGCRQSIRLCSPAVYIVQRAALYFIAITLRPGAATQSLGVLIARPYGTSCQTFTLIYLSGPWQFAQLSVLPSNVD